MFGGGHERVSYDGVFSGHPIAVTLNLELSGGGTTNANNTLLLFRHLALASSIRLDMTALSFDFVVHDEFSLLHRHHTSAGL